MFRKGDPKPPTSGRRKGVLTKLQMQAAQRLADLNCDPIEGMAKIAADPETPIEIRARMFAELAKYVYPQLKAVEQRFVDGDGNDRDVSVVVSYEDLPPKSPAPTPGAEISTR